MGKKFLYPFVVGLVVIGCLFLPTACQKAQVPASDEEQPPSSRFPDVEYASLDDLDPEADIVCFRFSDKAEKPVEGDLKQEVLEYLSLVEYREPYTDPDVDGFSDIWLRCYAFDGEEILLYIAGLKAGDHSVLIEETGKVKTLAAIPQKYDYLFRSLWDAFYEPW
jgi:hypothetical protein